MEREHLNILADAIREYYGNYELEDLCHKFNVEVDYVGVNPNHKKLASQLITQTEPPHGKLLQKILPDLFQRCQHRILNSTWESNVFDEQMLRQLKKLQLVLAQEKKPVVTAAPQNYLFKSKAQIATFFARAKTAVTIVDTRIGPHTLECVQAVKHPMRLLTAKDDHALAADFNKMLKAFFSGGRAVEIRRHLVLNDRYLFLNGRCWLVSAPLNTAAQSALCIIECIDAKVAIARAVEQKWREAEVYKV